jgi:hypothetical protein
LFSTFECRIALNPGGMYVRTIMAEPDDNVSKLELDVAEIERLESVFPAASGSAFAAARQKVLASGQSVLQSENGIIYEVFPDGHRREVKRIEPPTPIQRGRKAILT